MTHPDTFSINSSLTYSSFYVQTELKKIAQPLCLKEWGEAVTSPGAHKQRGTRLIVFSVDICCLCLLRCNQKGHFIALKDVGGKAVCGTEHKHADSTLGFLDKFLFYAHCAAR
jgi:hypothetical protein